MVTIPKKSKGGVSLSSADVPSITPDSDMGLLIPLQPTQDPALEGAPSGFSLPVKEIRVPAGAGVLYELCGDIRTMPGLPTHPAGEKVDIDKDGKIVGLF